MTIHHDKLAYGRLARTSEEVSEERLQEMLKALAEDKNEVGDEAEEKEQGKGEKK